MQDWWQATFPAGRQTLTIIDAQGQPVAIAYGEKGTGQPLVLVHGTASWSYSWRDLIDGLAQHFRVICFDAKGHGYSQTGESDEVVGHQVIELARVLQGLCDRPAVLVSQSLGALAALAVAEQHPELVAQLVVINVPIFPRRLPTWSMQWMAHLPLGLIQWSDRLRLARFVAPLIRKTVQFARREVMVDPTAITPEEVYWITYPYIEFPGTISQFAIDMRQAAREIQALLKGQPNCIQPIQQDLSAIACPTLILWGEQDRWFPASNGQELHARLPNSQLHIIPNCGHDAAAGCPDAISEAILAFTHDVEQASHPLADKISALPASE